MIIYDEPAEAYHKNPALGSGDIRAMIRSPLLFSDIQQNETEDRTTDAMQFGKVTHLALLEPAKYEAEIAIKPDGMSFATREGKAWREQHASKIIVDWKDATRLAAMAKRMPPEVRKMLTRVHTEVTVRTTMDDIPVQCRVDAWDMEGGIKYELKTIAALETMERDIWKRGYHVQDRWYHLVINTEKSHPLRASKFIFAETNPPYRWRVVELDAEYRMLADAEIDKAWNEIVRRTASGDWSDPAELHVTASPPRWLAEDDDTDNDEEPAA